MHIHPITEESKICPCGAVISEDEHKDLCAKCRLRVRWARRAEGRRRQQFVGEARRNGAWS